MTTIRATEAARNFSDILDRVSFRGEEFVIVRGGVTVARLSPAAPVPPALGDLVTRLAAVRSGDPDFATDLEWIQRHQPSLRKDPWRS